MTAFFQEPPLKKQKISSIKSIVRDESTFRESSDNKMLESKELKANNDDKEENDEPYFYSLHINQAEARALSR